MCGETAVPWGYARTQAPDLHPAVAIFERPQPVPLRRSAQVFQRGEKALL